MIGLALVAFVLIPSVVNAQLEKRSQAIAVATRSEAKRLKKTLFKDMLVRLFAPEAWSTLQKAQVYLKLNDGRAAAKWFAETAKLCRAPDAVMLVSAQAHAHVVAGDRKKARELLRKLSKAKLMGPRDQLDLGIVLLSSDLKRNRQAIAYIEAAQKIIGDHPRVIAALALGLQRAERIDEASEMLEKAQICLQDDDDPVVETLVKRARQGLRRYIEAQLRRERRARSRRTTIVVTSEHAVTVSGEIGGGQGGGPPVPDDPSQAEALRARGWVAGTPEPVPEVEPEPESKSEPEVETEASSSGTGFEIDMSEGDPEAAEASADTHISTAKPVPEGARDEPEDSDEVAESSSEQPPGDEVPAATEASEASNTAEVSDDAHATSLSGVPVPRSEFPGLTIPRLVPAGVVSNGQTETSGPKLQSATHVVDAGEGFFKATQSELGDRLKPPPISEVSERGARLFRATPLPETPETTPEPEGGEKSDARAVRPGRGLGAAFGVVPPKSSEPSGAHNGG